MAGFTSERRRAARSDWSGPERRGELDAGKGIADMMDPAAEEAYWREKYSSEPYYEQGYAYDEYHAAYRCGWEGRARYENCSFDAIERELEAEYNRNRGNSRLEWSKARRAARAAWDRFDATDPFERSQ